MAGLYVVAALCGGLAIFAQEVVFEYGVVACDDDDGAVEQATVPEVGHEVADAAVGIVDATEVVAQHGRHVGVEVQWVVLHAVEGRVGGDGEHLEAEGLGSDGVEPALGELEEGLVANLALGDRLMVAVGE